MITSKRRISKKISPRGGAIKLERKPTVVRSISAESQSKTHIVNERQTSKLDHTISWLQLKKAQQQKRKEQLKELKEKKMAELKLIQEVEQQQKQTRRQQTKHFRSLLRVMQKRKKKDKEIAVRRAMIVNYRAQLENRKKYAGIKLQRNKSMPSLLIANSLRAKLETFINENNN